MVQPAPPLTVKALAVQQDLLVLRISSLMTSLFELKSRLALMDDPQVFNEILFWLFWGNCLNLFPPHQSISSTTVLQLQQRSLLERIRELNDEIQSISYALNNNNNNGKVPSTPQVPCCTEKTDIVGSGVKKKNRVGIRMVFFPNWNWAKICISLTSELF